MLRRDRGITSRFFDDEEFATVPLEERRALSRVTLQGLVARAESAIQAGTLDRRTNRCMVWTEFELDDLGWREFAATMAAGFEEVERIRRQAEERLAETA